MAQPLSQFLQQASILRGEIQSSCREGTFAAWMASETRLPHELIEPVWPDNW